MINRWLESGRGSDMHDHMVRDFNLIREILLHVEKAPSGEPLHTLQMEDNIADAVVGEHIALLVDAGLVEGAVCSLKPLLFTIVRLTWAGHDFLENARNDTVWKKVMAEAKAKGTSVSMAVLNGLLAKAAQKYAGLA